MASFYKLTSRDDFNGLYGYLQELKRCFQKKKTDLEEALTETNAKVLIEKNTFASLSFIFIRIVELPVEVKCLRKNKLGHIFHSSYLSFGCSLREKVEISLRDTYGKENHQDLLSILDDREAKIIGFALAEYPVPYIDPVRYELLAYIVY